MDILYPTGILKFPTPNIVSSGSIIDYDHITTLYNAVSGVEQTIGLSPLNGFSSLTARITGIESGYTVIATGFVNKSGDTVNGTLNASVISGTIISGRTITLSNLNANGITMNGTSATIASNTNLLLGDASTLSLYFRPGGANSTNDVNIDAGRGLTIASGNNRRLISPSASISIISGIDIFGLNISGNKLTVNNLNGFLYASSGVVGISGIFANNFNSGLLLSSDWNAFQSGYTQGQTLSGYFKKVGDTMVSGFVQSGLDVAGTLTVGVSNVAGKNNFAGGELSIAIGTDSLAYGYHAIASGNYSVALGSGPIALADGSVAIGMASLATAVGAVALGASVASGVLSFATVNGVARGYSSVAIGHHVESNADGSWFISDRIGGDLNYPDGNNIPDSLMARFTNGFILHSGTSLYTITSGMNSIGSPSGVFLSGYFDNISSPSVNKVWGYFDGSQSTPTILNGYGLSGIKKNSPGKYTVQVRGGFLNTTGYMVQVTQQISSGTNQTYTWSKVYNQNTTYFQIDILSGIVSPGTPCDSTTINFNIFNDI